MNGNRGESELYGRVLAILVFSDDAFPEALRLKRAGVRLLVGLRDGEMRDESLWDRWSAAGLEVMSIWDAVESADVIQVW